MILAAGILFFVENNALAEDVTITTYYPAPYGVYGELVVDKNLTNNSATVTGLLVDIDESGINTGIVTGLDVDVSGVTSATYYAATFQGGNVGIGTAGPGARLQIGDYPNTTYRPLYVQGSAAAGHHTAAFVNPQNFGIALGARDGDNYGLIGAYQFDSGGGQIPGANLILNIHGGNVGIGTTTGPGYELDVNGGARISSNVGIGGDPGTGENMLKVYGKILTNHPGIGAIQHIFQFDIAEDILAEGCESGGVVVIDPNNNQKVIKCTKSFDTTVAGVISEDPAFHIGKQDKEGYLPLALAGRIPCKVTTENGPIKRGDLLVTSSKPGYAMRADPDKLRPGMILGKALEPLEGDGKIVVLIK